MTPLRCLQKQHCTRIARHHADLPEADVAQIKPDEPNVSSNNMAAIGSGPGLPLRALL